MLACQRALLDDSYQERGATPSPLTQQEADKRPAGLHVEAKAVHQVILAMLPVSCPALEVT